MNPAPADAHAHANGVDTVIEVVDLDAIEEALVSGRGDGPGEELRLLPVDDGDDMPVAPPNGIPKNDRGKTRPESSEKYSVDDAEGSFDNKRPKEVPGVLSPSRFAHPRSRPHFETRHVRTRHPGDQVPHDSAWVPQVQPEGQAELALGRRE